MALTVPPRWRRCPRKGKVIAGKFLPFKSPLSAQYDDSLSEEHRFHVDMLIQYVEAMGQRMGLVVDLTKSYRYYDKQELQDRGIAHYKILCEGYRQTPTVAQVKEFISVSNHFFKDHEGELVGIHCTHGFNRTGFLIAAYLVEEECWDLETAVTAFATARHPGIYKGEYLQDLADRYNGGVLGDLCTPSLPDWCFEDQEDEESGDEPSLAPKPKRRRELIKENAKFAVDTPEVEVVRDAKDIQRACQKILGWARSGFPGAQAVSMDLRNIGFINQKPYRVSWKADGTRYLLYIRGPGQVYLLDRDNTVFLAKNLSFPHRKSPDGHVTETLADSELVIDQVDKGKSPPRPRLLIYDIIQFMGSTDVGRCKHDTRLLCIDKELVQPREAAAKEGRLDKSMEPFGVRAKTFWKVSEVRMLLDEFIPRLTHENDGLIFSPAAEAYQAGKCLDLLKWKPEDLNSVDFKLNIVERSSEGMLPVKVGQLFVGGYNQPFSQLDLLDHGNKDAKKLSGRIIECSWNKTKKKWMYMRLREDKSFPNALETARSVCNSIQNPVTKEWMVEVCEKHHWVSPSGTGQDRPDASPAKPSSSSETESMPPPRMPLRPQRT